MPRMLTACLVAAAFSALPSCSSRPNFRPNPAYHSTRFPETRSMSEAKLWLYWSKAERLAFVRGFVIAYRDGAVYGCLDAFEHSTPASGADKKTSDHAVCYQEGNQFDRDVGDYETSTTSFYKTYPQDDDVPIRFVLAELASHKTPAEIHNALTPRGP